MAVDSFARRLAAAAIQKGGSDVTKEYVDAELDKKYDKTGGAITGDVAITGNLAVSGTTTTEKEKQLLVEDNVIVTNANKIDLKTLLSGLAINKNENATYGIMYDPTDDTVKFGEGTIGENNKFVFKDGEGLPLAIRADSNQFVDGCLVKWDASTNSFVKSDLTDENVGKKIDKIDFSNGQATVTFDTADGMTLVGTGQLTHSDKSTSQIGTDIEIPIIPGDGVIMDATTNANHVTVKVDPEHSVYMATAPEAENAIPMYAKSSKAWIGLTATPSATASSVATRDANGRMQVGAPAVGGDVANKAYVDEQTPKIGTTTNKNNLTAIEYIGEADIPTTPETGKEYAITDLISYSDLDSELQGKIDAAATIGYVDTAVSNKQDKLTAGTGIVIDADETNVHAEIKVDSHVAYLPDVQPTGTRMAIYENGKWNSTNVSRTADNYSIARRGATGTLAVGTPTADEHAATKAYVDTAVAGAGGGTSYTAGTGISIENDTIAVTKNVATIATLPELPADVIPYYSGDLATWNNKEMAVGSRGNTIALRTASGTLTVATPTAATDAATKAYVDDSVGGKQNTLTAGTGINIDSDTVKISDNVSRTSATDMGVWIPVQTRPAGPPTWSDVPVGADEATASSIVRRTAAGQIYTASPTANGHAATKAYVDAAIVAEGPASTIVNLSAPDEAVNGTLTEDELAKLQASDNASIMFAHKKYDLGGKGHQEGYLTYTHAGYENNVHILESITITISTRAWVLNATEVMDEEEIKAAITPMIPATPTWKTTAPTTDADKAKVQFTKVTIATTDETNFPGMNGRYALVPGFTNDGFHYGTVVCSQADPAYEFPFIGSITSEMASGIIVKTGIAPTYLSVVDPEVTFTYEYLW